MTRPEITQLSLEIYKLVDTQMFAIAFGKLRLLLKELSQWWATSRCEELELMCQQMLKYSLGDFHDPDRDKMIQKLQNDLFILIDDVVEAIAVKSSNSYEYEQKRILGINNHIHYEELIPFLKKNNEISFDDNKSNAIDLIFKNIWLSDKLTEDDVKIISIIENDFDIEQSAREIVISSLMLKGIRRYDSLLIKLLLDLARIEEKGIRVRTIVAIVMILSIYPTRIYKDNELKNSLIKLFEDEAFIFELETAYKSIINTFGTDKITNKINKEIYPELLKSSSKIQQMLKDDVSDIIGEDEFNPKWEKALDDVGFSDKLREFNDMQMKGDDVYMSTFSNMKGFPFFSDVAHWFMPFDVKQKDVASQMKEYPEIIKFFAASKNMCDSDKYSFLYSIINIPIGNLKSMMSGIGGDVEVLREEMNSEEWKERNDKLTVPFTLRSYVLDIYRFYKLFSRRAEFINPFEKIDKIDENILLRELLPLSLKKKICKYLFEVEHYKECKPLFEYLDKQQVWDAYFYQQMGHCYQSLKMWNEAIGSYEKSDLLEPNDIWTLKHKALCYKKISATEKAIECYEEILNIKDDISSILNLAVCYAQIGDMSKARSLYYKADYLKPDNIKVMRGLAWCLFVTKEYEKALDIYKKIMLHEDFSVEDAIRSGHVTWVNGEKEKARELYNKARILINSDIKFAEKMLDESENFYNIGLTDSDILILINQVLFK